MSRYLTRHATSHTTSFTRCATRRVRFRGTMRSLRLADQCTHGLQQRSMPHRHGHGRSLAHLWLAHTCCPFISWNSSMRDVLKQLPCVVCSPNYHMWFAQFPSRRYGASINEAERMLELNGTSDPKGCVTHTTLTQEAVPRVTDMNLLEAPLSC
jgi:hypothetical protein